MRRRPVVALTWVAALAACGLADLLPALRGQSFPSTRPTAATSRATASEVTGPSPLAAVSYFETSCARCHGPYGSAYGPTFGQHLSEAELTKVCDDMAAGPGNAPVEVGQLKVLVDYHKAMIAKRPFAIVTKATDGPAGVTLEGETLPESTVTVGEAAAKVDGHDWTATVPKAEQYTITAKLGGATTVVTFKP